MPERVSPLTPGFTYSVESRQYRSAETGRFVPRATVQAALDAVVDTSAGRMRALAEQLQARTVSLADFQAGMQREIKAAHLAAGASANGGWAEMSPSRYGEVGREVRDQYAYLRNMANDIATGRQPLDGRLLQRAELYGRAARATAREIERRNGRRAGDLFERNLRHASESCAGCVAASAEGVVPIGTLPRVGARDCKVNCKCTIETLAFAEAEALAA